MLRNTSGYPGSLPGRRKARREGVGGSGVETLDKITTEKPILLISHSCHLVSPHESDKSLYYGTLISNGDRCALKEHEYVAQSWLSNELRLLPPGDTLTNEVRGAKTEILGANTFYMSPATRSLGILMGCARPNAEYSLVWAHFLLMKSRNLQH